MLADAPTDVCMHIVNQIFRLHFLTTSHLLTFLEGSHPNFFRSFVCISDANFYSVYLILSHFLHIVYVCSRCRCRYRSVSCTVFFFYIPTEYLNSLWIVNKTRRQLQLQSMLMNFFPESFQRAQLPFRSHTVAHYSFFYYFYYFVLFSLCCVWFAIIYILIHLACILWFL